MTASCRVLVVEDEGIIARDIARQLESLGCSAVAIAAAGEEAIALARSHSPDLILMDIRLEGAMDGVEAAMAIRRERSVPVIFLTAFATQEVVERAKLADPAGYIIKPFDEQLLRTTIEIALNKDRVERELRRSESRYRALLDSAPDAIVTADSEGNIVGWSASACTLFGHTEAEAIGQPLAILMPPRERAQHPSVASQTQEFNRWAVLGDLREMVGWHREGREFPIQVTLSRWETAEGWFVTAFIRDASALRSSDAQLRMQSAALNAVPSGVVVLGLDNKIQWVNPAFTALTGFSLDEAVGQSPFELLHSAATVTDTVEAVRQTLLTGKPWVGEMVNVRKDGTPYTEELTLTWVRNAMGAVTHLIGIQRDLTEPRRLQQQFLQAQKMEVVGRLAGGIAHDFNNLLTVINGASELVLMDLAEDDPMRPDLLEIRGAAERAARLTRQLLAFSRKQHVTPTVVSVSAQVINAAKMLRRLIGEDIELVLRPVEPGVGDEVLIDPGQFEQVLLNVAVNARDAMPGGGTLTVVVSVVALDASGSVAHPMLVPGRHVRLDMIDTGSGMTEAVRAHLFEPFFTTKAQGKGTGLGLATVYGIVAQSGGAVVVDSEVGRGTTFSLLFPCARALEAVAAQASQHPARGSETILLVEDEDGLRELTTRMLQSAGYTVLPVCGGREALSALSTHHGPVHLLFTDVVMPGMSGPSLASRVAATYPQLRVLFASGYADDSKMGQEVLGESSHFIAKPYSVSELTRKVRAVLEAPAPKLT